MKTLNLSLAQIARFWANADRSAGPDGCWPWLLSTHRRGYGQMSHGKANWKTHKVAFLISGGILTDEKPWVLHSCHNPICVNPRHLRAGSPKDNVDDMINAGRKKIVRTFGDQNGSRTHPEKLIRGEEVPASKLNAELVLELRAEESNGGSHRDLAVKYGVSHATVGHICRRKTWKHI